MAVNEGSVKLDRRQLLTGSVLVGSSLAIAAHTGVTPALAALPQETFVPVPIPSQPPFREGVADIPGTRLYYRDYGGNGIPLVLMHPATGSALMWVYQVPAFVKAGYRVIAYSRRGYFGSEPADRANAGQPSTDLLNLMDKLGIGKFAVMASAAGCTISLDFAISHSERLHAMILCAGSFGNIEEDDYQRVSQAVLTKGFAEMPPEFRELGPSYRAANPAGVKEWLDFEHKALSGNRLGPTNVNKFTWANLAKVKTSTLFVAGGADLYAPPPMLRIVAGHVANSEMVIVPDSGHSIYWELPDAFNKTVLDFLGRHAK